MANKKPIVVDAGGSGLIGAIQSGDVLDPTYLPTTIAYKDQTSDITGVWSFALNQWVPNNAATGFRTIKNIKSYVNNSASQTGTIKIKLPVSWTDTMQQYRIKVYNHVADEAGLELVIAGLNQISSTLWVNTSVTINKKSTALTSVRFGHDGTNCCILLGTVSSAWQYPKVSIEEVSLSNAGANNASWVDAALWTITLIASESGITVTGGLAGTPTLLPPNQTFTSTTAGIVPQSGGGTTNFLRADGTWAAPDGAGSNADTLDGLDSTAFGILALPATWTASQTFDATDATTNTVLRPLTVQRQSTGTPSSGIGAGIQFNVETAASVIKTGAYLDVLTTSNVGGSEDFDLVVSTMLDGATPTEVARFKSNNTTRLMGSLGLFGTTPSTVTGITSTASLDSNSTVLGFANITTTLTDADLTGNRINYTELLVLVNEQDGVLNSGVTITNATWSGGVATYTANSHGFATNDKVAVTSIRPNGYNGFFTVTVTGTNTFTAPVPVDPGTFGNSGTAQKDHGFTQTLFGSYNQVLTGGSFNVASCTTSTSNVTLTTTGDFVVAGVLRGMTLVGTGIPRGTYVVEINSNNQLTLSETPTVSGTATMTFYKPGTSDTVYADRVLMYNRGGLLGKSDIGTVYGRYTDVNNQYYTQGSIGIAYGSYTNVANNSLLGVVSSGYGDFIHMHSNGSATAVLPQYIATYNHLEVDASTLTIGYGVYNRLDRNGGTFVTAIGMFNSFEGTITNKWGIYSLNDNGNYLTGGLQIGGSAPSVSGGYSGLPLQVTGAGSFTSYVQAANFADATGTYNVNLGNGSTEGRGLVAGYSGTSYGGIGYNVRHTSTSAQWTGVSTDTATYLLFNGGGLTMYGWAAGSAGRTLTPATKFAVDVSGNATVAGTLTVSGSSATVNGGTLWHSGNDGPGTTLSAGLLGALDSRAVLHAPQDRDAGMYFDMKSNTTDGLADGGTYHGVVTLRHYGSTSDMTGGKAHQLGFTEKGLFHRSSINATTWNSWDRIRTDVYSDDTTGGQFQIASGGTYSVSGAVTGTIQIVLPAITSQSSMVRIVIKGYDYTSKGAYTLVVGGYMYATSTNWHNANYSAYLYGRAPFSSVRFGKVGTSYVLLLGTLTTAWNYPKLWVESIDVGYANVGLNWGTGWSTTLLASESGITVVNTVSDLYSWMGKTDVVGIGSTGIAVYAGLSGSSHQIRAIEAGAGMSVAESADGTAVVITSTATETSSIYLHNDRASTSITLANVTDFNFPVAANSVYKIELTGYFTTAATTTGLILGATAPTGSVMTMQATLANATTTTMTTLGVAGTTSVSATFTNAPAGNTPVTAKFTLVTAGTAGTFQLQHATEVASSAATLKTGTCMTLQKITNKTPAATLTFTATPTFNSVNYTSTEIVTSGTAQASITLTAKNDGTWSIAGGAGDTFGGTPTSGNWATPTTAGAGTDYEVRFTATSVTGGSISNSASSWTNLASNKTCTHTVGSFVGSGTASLQMEVRKVGQSSPGSSATLTTAISAFTDDPCVCIESFMPLGMQAKHVSVGHPLYVLTDSYHSYEQDKVLSFKIVPADCVRITDSRGITLVVSYNTPVTQPDGQTVLARESTGFEIAFLDDGEFGWSRIVSIEELGERPVAHISCRDKTYAAGEQPHRYLFTHNAKN